MKYLYQHEDIDTVSGAKSGGSHTPVDAPTTLASKTTARILFLLGQGENGGLYDQTNPLKSVFLNNTPVMNSDGSLNFTNVQLSERYGLPSQTYMPGYPSASDSLNVGQKITTTLPQTWTTSVNGIDAVRVTIRFPALFKQETNGDTNGTSVQFRISRKLGAGSYSVVNTFTKTGKSTVPADVDYLIQRPDQGGTATWTVKVERITADNVTPTMGNDIYFQFATEIQNAQLPYNKMGYIGLTTNSETTGQDFPLVAFDYNGRKVKVPSNYNATTRVYTGTWDGTMSSTKVVTDNPAWALYDLLTDPDIGMGSIIASSDIDQYSFYDAAVYNDALVPAVVNGVISGTEPRFRFNYQYMERVSAWTMLQNLAATMNAVVYTSGNRVRLVQDRPTGFSRLFTNSNVEDGMFEYASASRSSRMTACTAYWNDPSQNWLSVPSYYEDTSSAGSAGPLGLRLEEVTGIGVTSEGQALRMAKWHVDTSLNNTETVTFKIGAQHAGLEPGEVVKIMDDNYSGSVQEAKVVSFTATTVTLDKALTVANGNTFDVLSSDGASILTRTISAASTGNTITFTGAALTVSTGADLIVTGAISPRFFKITSVKELSPLKWLVSGLMYDPNKFGRVDSTPTGATLVYQAKPSMQVVSPVTGITFAEQSYMNADGTPQRRLNVTWTPPAGQFVTSYKVFWNKNDGTPVDLGTLVQPTCLIPVDTDGSYNVTVIAVNSFGVRSLPATATDAVNLLAPAGASPLVAVTGLTVKGGGTSFNTIDAPIVWTDPNVSGTAVVYGYQVQILDAITPSTVYRTEFVTTPSYTYDYTKNLTDNPTGVKRSFIVSVKVKDTFGRVSTATQTTISNPAPAAVTLTVTSGYQNNIAHFVRPTDFDFAGFILWGSTSSSFTPSTGTKLYEGMDDSFIHSGLGDSQTWYYKVAAYDTFGKDYAGAGLNVTSGTVNGTTASGATVNEYQLNGVTWTPNSPTANKVAWTACTAVQTLGTGMGTSWAITAGNATWTSGILYIYYVAGNTTLSSTASLSTALAASTNVIVATYRGGTLLEVGNGNAYTDGSFIIAGTVGATQVVTSGLITQSAQINNALITDAHFTGLLQAVKIDTRGLNIKDAAGNIIFSSGSQLGNDAATSLGFNPTFSAWSGTYPDNWGAWTGTAGSKNASTVLPGSLFSVDYTTNGSDSGMLKTFVYPTTAPLPAGSFVSGSVSLYMVNNAGGGPPGYLVRLFTNSALTTYVDNKVTIPNQTVSGWQKFPFTATAGGAAIYAIYIYQMASWSGFTGGSGANGNRMLFGPFTFDVNTAVDSSVINPSSNWLNSNVSIGSNGVLSGAGGGTVTIGGLGYTGALNATADISLLGRVNCVVAGNAVTKVGGAASWDSDAYSKDSYTGGSYATAVVPNVSGVAMFGLNSDPTTDASYTSLDYAWYFNGTALAIYESNTNPLSGLTLAAGDVLAVTYDGVNVNYYQNGVVRRTVAASAGLKLFWDSSFNSVGSSVTNIGFGPMTSVSSVTAAAAAAATTATWSGVSGSGKPADNATVGATFGSNISGQITSGNASTYIAAAAIGSAQVGTLLAGNIGAGQVTAAKLAVTSLDAITATIGTLRTASTGQRMEIQDNRIRIYDASNVCRVKIGDLS